MTIMYDFKGFLRTKGLKETPKRVHLLKLLAGEREPVTIADLVKKARATANSVTIYRALEAFVGAGIVKRIDFREREARYELVHDREHHHHLVCGDCGIVEDVEACQPVTLERSVLKSSKRFASIDSHALEFFGTCKSCVTK